MIIYPELNSKAQANLQPFSKLGYWDKLKYNIIIFNRAHPVFTKITAIFTLCVGLALLSTMNLPSPHLFGGLIKVLFIALGSTASFVGLSSLLIFSIASIIVAPRHDAKHHTYKEKTIQTEDMHGSLKYDNNIPILTLHEAHNRAKAGKTYGYLLAKELSTLVGKFRFLLNSRGSPLRMPQPQEMKQTLEEIQKTIPKEFIEEMQGCVEGYNQWCDEQHKTKQKATFEELLMIQLIPDASHCRFMDLKDSRSAHEPIEEMHMHEVPKNGCATILAKDEHRGLICGRNLDWNIFQVCGTFNVVVKREFENYKKTVHIGPPGLLGPLTGMNQDGVSIAMNITRPLKATKTIDGMPALFYNRCILENCESAQSAKEWIEHNTCFGPNHLTVLDEHSGYICHLRQGNEDIHYIRSFDENKGALYTTNPYFDKAVRNEHRDRFFWTKERETRIQNFLEFAYDWKANKKIKYALQLPYVNNFITSQSIMLYPREKSLKISAANSYSASEKRSEIKPFEDMKRLTL